MTWSAESGQECGGTGNSDMFSRLAMWPGDSEGVTDVMISFAFAAAE